MMNIYLVYNPFKGLPLEKDEELFVALFKKSRQTMAYLKRSKDISLSKLKNLADIYYMTLDYFREETVSKAKRVYGPKTMQTMFL